VLCCGIRLVDVKQPIAVMSASFFGVSGNKLLHFVLLLEGFLKAGYIFLIGGNGMALHFLFLPNNLLVVVAIPEVIIASDMTHNGGNQLMQLGLPLVAH